MFLDLDVPDIHIESSAGAAVKVLGFKSLHCAHTALLFRMKNGIT